MHRTIRLLAGGGILGLLLGGAPASAQRPPSPEPEDSALAVPFVPQSELLCGGAALAMIERWWGRRGVYAEDFGALVRPELGGIRTTDLANAAARRDWRTELLANGEDRLRLLLDAGIPVIALIRVGHDRYHYIVLLGWSAGVVTFHDPARGPNRRLPETRFRSAWTGADRWALLVTPAPLPPAATVSTAAAAPDSLPCRPWLDQAVDAVPAGRLPDADSLLATASRACPDEPLVRRERSGLRFRQHRYAEAAALSREYLDANQGDTLAWQLLAASDFLAGQRDRALVAWNHLGRPVIDLVRLDGLHETRFAVVDEALDLDDGTRLTAPDLALARRRVAEVPALRRTRVEYQPLADGRVEVHTVVTERRTLDPTWRLIAGGAVRALTSDELGLSVASPTGGGELWSVTWRWARAHPRVGGRVELPIRLGTPGVFTVNGSGERWRFSLDTAPTGAVVESRRSSGIGFGSWLTPGVRPAIGLRLDSWSGSRSYLAVAGRVEFRALHDRLRLSSATEYGASLGPHGGYLRGRALAAWTSGSTIDRASWSGRIGANLVSGATPLGLRPMASDLIAWDIPLRAHPQSAGGLLSGTTTARDILHGGLSGDHPLFRAGPVTVAAGLFLDGARMIRPASGTPAGPLYLDAGGGLRVGLGDGSLGVLRIDLATGLTDRRMALTAGVHQVWPPFGITSHGMGEEEAQ